MKEESAGRRRRRRRRKEGQLVSNVDMVAIQGYSGGTRIGFPSGAQPVRLARIEKGRPFHSSGRAGR